MPKNGRKWNLLPQQMACRKKLKLREKKRRFNSCLRMCIFFRITIQFSFSFFFSVPCLSCLLFMPDEVMFIAFIICRSNRKQTRQIKLNSVSTEHPVLRTKPYMGLESFHCQFLILNSEFLIYG